MIRLDSTETELQALDAVAQRLLGFDGRLSLEWIDGAFTALLAGPRVPAGVAEVVEPLFGDAWGRTFADPDDQGQALAALQTRWRVLRSQLDPEALWEAPDALRLSPLLLAPVADEADEAEADVQEETEAEADGPRLGLEWVQGFLAVVDDPGWGWDAAVPDEAYTLSLDVLRALALEDTAACHARIVELLREPDLAAESLIDQACWEAQDLRLWWVENAPRTAPRRVEATPGRNDPCPCGSGKKFKKCHGAA